MPFILSTIPIHSDFVVGSLTLQYLKKVFVTWAEFGLNLA